MMSLVWPRQLPRVLWTPRTWTAHLLTLALHHQLLGDHINGHVMLWATREAEPPATSDLAGVALAVVSYELRVSS